LIKYYKDFYLPQKEIKEKRILNQVEKEKADKISSSILLKSDEIIENHKIQLGKQREKSTFRDAYGKLNTNKWENVEIPYFIQTHIVTELEFDEMKYFESKRFIISEIINQVAIENSIKNEKYSSEMDGFEFEIFCKSKLELEGWNVMKTKNGADQGVDLIIKKNDRKVGVQCKKYNTPIGNKSVQEIYSGIKFYGLTEGIVLTNNDFTKSAKELAESLDIKLIHYLETQKI
jgi:hypothetical protein